MSENTNVKSETELSAASIAVAESAQIVNLLNESQGESCCGGSCCSA